MEEQFYLVWPAVILLIARGRNAARRTRSGPGCDRGRVGRRKHPGHRRRAELGVLLPADPRLGARRSAVSSQSARVRSRGCPGRLVGLAGWIGVAAIVESIALFNAELPFPGWVAILPSLGTAVLLAGGARALGPGRLLSIPLLRWVGRISYSLYLVHWPILVLAPLALGVEANMATNLALVGLSLLVAIAPVGGSSRRRSGPACRALPGARAARSRWRCRRSSRSSSVQRSRPWAWPRTIPVHRSPLPARSHGRARWPLTPPNPSDRPDAARQPEPPLRPADARAHAGPEPDAGPGRRQPWPATRRRAAAAPIRPRRRGAPARRRLPRVRTSGGAAEVRLRREGRDVHRGARRRLARRALVSGARAPRRAQGLAGRHVPEGLLPIHRHAGHESRPEARVPGVCCVQRGHDPAPWRAQAGPDAGLGRAGSRRARSPRPTTPSRRRAQQSGGCWPGCLARRC